MKLNYLPLILAILGGVIYHISQKSIPHNSNPIFAVIIAYIAGILILSCFYFLYPSDKTFLETIKEFNWSMVMVGVGASMIEIGVLLAYRVGWNIGITSTIMGASVALLLIPVGIIIYKEQLSIWNLLGVLFCVIGLAFLVKK
ncbi:MAG: DMT family transporter [Acidobacteria bacterium]|nr:DMT family transporter [Acidobacteriota bacterium]